MNKQAILTFLSATISIICFGHNLKENWWHDYEGKLGIADVQLSIYLLDEGHLKGNYCYKKHEIKIQLEGQIVEGKVELTEMLNGKVNGYFDGRIDSLDNFAGTWTDSSKKRTTGFKLYLRSSCYSASFEHRYSDLNETDITVENFMKRAKRSVLQNDKKWLAGNIYFPVKVIVDAKKITIKNKEQLLNNFNNIFNQRFKDKVSSAYTCNLFMNGQGVMLGNGEIWINNFLTSDNKPKLYIKAINNQ